MAQHRISGLVLVLLGAACFFITPYQVNSIQSGNFPRTISALLVLLGILLALPSLKQKKRDGVRLLDPFLLVYLLIVFVGVLIIRHIGFYPGMMVTLPACLVLFGERNYIKMGLFTIITTGAIFLVIHLVLGNPLP